MAKNVIQVFEYGRLMVSEEVFTADHLKALALYNERHGGKYFTLLHNGVKFANFVGVIQVGNLTIEILPKSDKNTADENKNIWHQVLIDMLQECRMMQIDTNENAVLKLKHHSILEIYLEVFLNRCIVLLHEGLIKKYRKNETNSTSLKGRLLIANNIRHNIVHKERFYVAHNVYDRDNIYNQILAKAIKLVGSITTNPALVWKAGNILLDWPETKDVIANENVFDRIFFDRKTDRYKDIILIARMLLLNYRPDITGGPNHVLAILFDMNRLWEEFIYHRIRVCLMDAAFGDWSIYRQESADFWLRKNYSNSKTIRPDIVIRNSNGGSTIIVDTKWKVPDDQSPSDDDLKQMFVYNLYWKSDRSYLLYPKMSEAIHGRFHSFPQTSDLFHSNCSMISTSILNDGKLSDYIGRDILLQIGIE